MLFAGDTPVAQQDSRQEYSPVLLVRPDDVVLPTLLVSLASSMSAVPDDADEPLDEPTTNGLALPFKGAQLLPTCCGWLLAGCGACTGASAEGGAAQGQGGLAECDSASGDPTLNGPARVPAAGGQVYRRCHCDGVLEAEEAR